MSKHAKALGLKAMCDQPTFAEVEPLVVGHLVDVVPPEEGTGQPSTVEIYHLAAERVQTASTEWFVSACTGSLAF